MSITAVGALQSAYATGTTSVPMATFAVGDLVILTVAINAPPTSVTGVSGGGCTGWRRVASLSDGSVWRIEMWMGTVDAQAIADITATFSASVAGVLVEMNAQEFTAGLGPSTTWYADTTLFALAGSGTAVAYPSLTPTWPDELYAGFAVTANAISAGATSGFTYETPQLADSQFVWGDVSTTTAPTSTQASSGFVDAIGATFRALPTNMALFRAKISFDGPQQASPTFFDVSRYAISAKTSSGKQHELDRFEAGTCDLVLDNVDGTFTPWNKKGPYYNILSPDDASFEDSLGTWTAFANCSVTLQSAHVLKGSQAMVMTSSTTSGDLIAQVGNTTYPVSPGDVVTAIVHLRPYSTTRQVQAQLSWYDSGGTYISTSIGSLGTEGGGSWVKPSVTGTAPGGAAHFQIVAVVKSVTAILEQHAVDCAGVYYGSTVPVWTPGAIANAGPFVPMCSVALTAEWDGSVYPLWYGYVDSWDPIWQGQVYADMEVKATDGLKALNLFTLNPQDYPTTIVADGPLAYWQCNDQPSATQLQAGDENGLVPGSFNGSPILSGPFTPDKSAYGTGARLSDPAAGYLYLDAGGTPSGSISTSSVFAAGSYTGTFECWVNLTADSTLWTLASSNITISTTAGIVHLTVTGGTNISGGPSITDGNWHHVVVAVPVPGHGGTASLWVDGALIASAAETATVAWDLSGVVVLGANLGGYTLHGQVQDVAIYSTLLVDSQVQAHYQAGVAGWPKQATDGRVAALVDMAGFPVSLISGAGLVDIQARGQSPSATSLLSYINEALDTEEGRFYQGPDGNFYFRERTFPTTNARSLTPQVTYNDQGPLSGVNYEVGSPTLSFDELDLWNEAIVSANGFPRQQWTDFGSVARFISRVIQRSTYHVSVANMSAHAEYLVNKFSTPQPRVQDMVISLPSTDLGPNIIPFVLGSQFYDLVTVDRHMPLDGSAFSQNAFIEGIEHDITWGDQSKWTASLHLSAVS